MSNIQEVYLSPLRNNYLHTPSVFSLYALTFEKKRKLRLNLFRFSPKNVNVFITLLNSMKLTMTKLS